MKGRTVDCYFRPYQGKMSEGRHGARESIDVNDHSSSDSVHVRIATVIDSPRC